jgi:DNA-binding beta-propeller fold protein YncE
MTERPMKQAPRPGGRTLDVSGLPVLAASVAVAALLVTASCTQAPAQTPEAPGFDLDPDWPQAFQENWVLGAVTGVAVDSRGHIWVTHAQGMATAAAHGAAQDPPVSTCCIAAPGVLEFDPDGALVQTWDTDAGDYAWPDVPHGIYVDHNDFVWIASRPHHQLLKFNREGDLVLTIGELDVSGGSNDPDRLGLPAGVWVDPESNEVFVADGYGNRRVVVYDGETGAYLRHWGAYGEPPDDDYAYGSRDADAPPARQFGTVHGIVGSDDGLIYVADRRNNRVQVFQQDGGFVQERIVAAGTLGSGSAFDVALSPGPEHEFLYLMDGTNHKIWVLRRNDLEVLGEVGRGGYQVGQFVRPHNIATDARGNIYTSEAETKRVQRFVPRGAFAP